MLRTLIYILFVTGLCIGISLYASEDITRPDYMITLGKMDPMEHGNLSTSSGKGALLTILQNLSEILLFMVPLIAAVSFVIAGYYYIFSSGDAEKANKGKTIIKWNIIAMFVAFFSWTIVKIISVLFA